MQSISVGQVIYFEFRFQTVHMHFGIIEQLQCHEKIGNNKLICLKMLVLAVRIPEISKDLVDEKCLKKLCKNVEYFEDLTELTKRGKKFY